MKAAFLTGIRKVEVRDVPAPGKPGAGEALLRVDVLGVCGSDMHYFKEGRIGTQVVEYPFIVGHEFAATVEAVGDQVGDLRKGRRVAVDPLVACGQCDQCRNGRVHTCRDQRFMGCPGQMSGAMAQYVVMPARCCFPIPDEMTAEQAALTEPFSIALHARNLARTPECASVAILGCGPIGLCVLAALKAADPCEVYATDLLDERLALAGRLGADWTGNAAAGDVLAAIKRTQPLGMDRVFECAGKQETIDQAVELLAPGGTLVLVGIPPFDRFSLDMNLFRRKELRLQCVRRQNECVQTAIDMLAEGKVNLDALVTHHFLLEQSQQAFDMVADYRDGVVKAMIQISSETQ
ncbi:MAG: zinc-binding dehydrogenase [Phycisphaerae bacterium]